MWSNPDLIPDLIHVFLHYLQRSLSLRPSLPLLASVSFLLVFRIVHILEFIIQQSKGVSPSLFFRFTSAPRDRNSLQTMHQIIPVQLTDSTTNLCKCFDDTNIRAVTHQANGQLTVNVRPSVSVFWASFCSVSSRRRQFGRFSMLKSLCLRFTLFNICISAVLVLASLFE